MATHVSFKTESEANGLIVGPVTVYTLTPEDERSDRLGRPYVRKCICEPSPDAAMCPDCNGEVVRWVTQPEAEAIAAEHGVTLEVG